MEIERIVREYLPIQVGNQLTPNPRQAEALGKMLVRLVCRAAQDPDLDLEPYTSRVETFAEKHLQPGQATAFLTHFRQIVAEILRSRVVAHEFIDSLSEDEIYSTARPVYISKDPEVILLEVAAGISTKPYYNYSGDNAIIDRAIEIGLPFVSLYEEAGQYHNFELPLLGEAGEWTVEPDDHDNKPAVKKSRKLFVEQATIFLRAVQTLDNLFADIFEAEWRLPEARIWMRETYALLTKPLEKYSYIGDLEQGWPTFQNAAAADAHRALQEVKKWKKKSTGKQNMLGRASEAGLAEKYENAIAWHGLYLDARTAAIARSDKDKARKAKATKTQDDLAEKPAVVRAIKNGDGFMVEPKSLLAGLTKRKGHVMFDGVLVSITMLRQWITATLKDPDTGRRVRGDLDAKNWLLVEKLDKPGLFKDCTTLDLVLDTFIVSPGARLKVRARWASARMEHLQYLHTIEFDLERERVVWTPEQIAEERPVIA